MRLFITFLGVSFLLYSHGLAAQFSDTTVVATQVDQTGLDYQFLLPTGQADPDSPLLVYGSAGNPVTVYYAGANSFRREVITVGGPNSGYERYEDFTGDGAADLLASGLLYPGLAGGGLATDPTDGPRLGTTMGYGDWNGDGLTDVFGFSSVGTFTNVGETFLYTAIGGVDYFAVDTLDRNFAEEGGGAYGDVNGDDLIDFCYLGGNSPAEQLICIVNEGAAPPRVEKVAIDVKGGNPVLADFNGDGFDDVALPGQAGGITIRYNDAGTFNDTEDEPLYDGGPGNLFSSHGGAADVDDDGDLDLIALLGPANDLTAEKSIAYFLNTGGDFGDPIVIGTVVTDGAFAYTRQALQVLDLNFDGRMDILINDAENGEAYAFFSTLGPVSLSDPRADIEEFSVFPNPVLGGLLRADLPSGVRVAGARAVGVDGRSVAVAVGAGGHSFYVGDLVAGVYVLVVRGVGGLQFRARFVVGG